MNIKPVVIFYPCEYHRLNTTHPRWVECGCRTVTEYASLESAARDPGRAEEHKRLAQN